MYLYNFVGGKENSVAIGGGLAVYRADCCWSNYHCSQCSGCLLQETEETPTAPHSCCSRYTISHPPAPYSYSS